MKCKSCGSPITRNTKICDKCGFDIVSFSKLQRVVIKEDPEVPKEKRTDIIDMPILAFIFGLLAVIFSLLFVASLPQIIIFYIFLILLCNILTFYFSKKPAKVKFIPFATVGKIFAYFSIGFIVFKVIFDLLGLLFFN